MAINKNFVVKHGLEVNNDLILANADTSKVGIATTNPEYNLHVNGGIGATDVYVSGIATVKTNLVLNGLLTANDSAGLAGQYLKSTSTGVEWASFPSLRTSSSLIATTGQTTFTFAYTVGLLDVYVNGVKLASTEFVASDGVSVILSTPCFGGEFIEFIGYAVSGVGAGVSGIAGITILEEGSITGNTGGVTSINFVGAAVTAVGTGAGVTVYITDTTGSSLQWETTSAGINTLSNVGIGTTNPRFALEVGSVGYGDTALWVNGNARITGILTVGTSSIVLDGVTDTLTVPNLVVTNSTTGVTASGAGVTVRDDGGNLGSASIIDFGDNLSVTFSSGIATITGSAGGGSSSQWVSTSAGIHTLSNVGIGTTNPTSALTVKGTSDLENVTVSGVSTFIDDVYFAGGRTQIISSGELKMQNLDRIMLGYSGGTPNGLVIRQNSSSNVSEIVNVGGDDIKIQADSGRSVFIGNDDDNDILTVAGYGVTVTGSTLFAKQLGVSGVVTATSFVGDGSGLTNLPGPQTGIGTFTASVGIAHTIDSFSTSQQTAEYTIYVGYGTYIQSQKVLVMNDGNNAYSQEYAIMYNSDLIVSIGASVYSGSVGLEVTPESGVSGLVTYRFVRQSI